MKPLTQWSAVAALLSVTVTPISAALIAQWTFETSLPTTAGPFNPEIGSGSALGFHTSGATAHSNPGGNGSNESFSSNNWSIGDQYQFSTSTLGFSSIRLALGQTGSRTGSRDFRLAYRTNGTAFTNVIDGSYALTDVTWSTPVGEPNPASSYSFDLSSISGLDNLATAYFRLIANSTSSINGGIVATAGTGSVDNFTISGTSVAAVPLPAALPLLMAGLGLIGLC